MRLSAMASTSSALVSKVETLAWEEASATASAERIATEACSAMIQSMEGSWLSFALMVDCAEVRSLPLT